MTKKIQNIFSSPGHLSQGDMDSYLRGDASPELTRKVENAMLDEPLFSDAVEGYEEMGMNALPSFEDFSELKKKWPQQPEAKVVRLNPSRRLMRVAAIGAVLIATAAIYFAFQSPSDAALFADYYQPYENDISLTRRSGEGDLALNGDLKVALGAYAQGDYEASIADFEKALQAEPANDAARFFAAQAYLKTGDLEKAVDYFSIVDANEGTYARKAEWYAILTTLKLGDREAASQLLDEFLQSSGYKSAEAQQLRKEI